MKKFALATLIFGSIIGGLSPQTTQAECFPYGENPTDWLFAEGKITVTADWILWRTEADNLAIASLTDTYTPKNIEENQFSKTKEINPDYKFQNGFKCNIAYELPTQQWEISANFTYIAPNADTGTYYATQFVDPNGNKEAETLQLNTSNYLLLQKQFPNGLKLSSINARWVSNLSNLDLDFARTLQLGDCFALKPHMGFRACWIYQKYSFEGTYGPQLANSKKGISEITGILKEKFQGFGAEGGLWAIWELGRGYSLIGHCGGSILYAVIRTDQSLFLPSLSQKVEAIEKGNKRTGIPTMDYFLGFQYDNSICDFAFTGRIGWEQHVMFNINRIAKRGDITAQGLNVGLELYF